MPRKKARWLYDPPHARELEKVRTDLAQYWNEILEKSGAYSSLIADELQEAHEHVSRAMGLVLAEPSGDADSVVGGSDSGDVGLPGARSDRVDRL